MCVIIINDNNNERFTFIAAVRLKIVHINPNLAYERGQQADPGSREAPTTSDRGPERSPHSVHFLFGVSLYSP